MSGMDGKIETMHRAIAHAKLDARVYGVPIRPHPNFDEFLFGKRLAGYVADPVFEVGDPNSDEDGVIPVIAIVGNLSPEADKKDQIMDALRMDDVSLRPLAEREGHRAIGSLLMQTTVASNGLLVWRI